MTGPHASYRDESTGGVREVVLPYPHRVNIETSDLGLDASRCCTH